MQKITPCLWFDNNAEEAVSFYISIFKNSKIRHITHYGDAAIVQMKKLDVKTLEQAYNQR